MIDFLHCIKESFNNPETLKSAGGSMIMYAVSLITVDTAVKSFCTYTALLIGIATAIVGLLRTIELWRITKLNRKKAQKENEELGI